MPFRRLISILLTTVLPAAAAFLAAGCAPSVICRVETVVLPDYSCQRSVRLDIFPNPRFPQHKPRLGDFFQFPPAEQYDSYAVRPEGAAFAGSFASYEQIPPDLARITPGSAARAANALSFRVMDMVLFVLADFDETIADIIAGEEDGQAALAEIIRICVPEIMAVLNARYGARYDLSRLDAWLNHDLPAKLARVYDGAWRIHAAKRSGVTSPGEEYEYYLFLMAEARREGLELAPPGTPNLREENLRRLREYGVRLAERLCPARDGGPGVGREGFSGIALDELAAAVQKAITARHGSINAFLGKLSALAPRAFGAYLIGSVMPFHMLPETTYRYRLRLPGAIIQTNGVRELNGDLAWSFSDNDLAFTGQSMWARTIFVREAAAAALNLQGFPASLADVDQTFGLCLSPAGTPREALLDALASAASAGGTAPLEALAANPSSPDAAAAKGMLELFTRHRRDRQPPAAQGGPAAP
ncbi:MAG: hypothetical protein LBV15_04130 [Planctomycetota bacterium]|jgi:hypothetical protein|nr:hypothetical protein [Planctomycetota bacterium]